MVNYGTTKLRLDLFELFERVCTRVGMWFVETWDYLGLWESRS